MIRRTGEVARYNDAVLELMKQNGIELTRENNFHIAFMGDVPEELDPELQIELDEMFPVISAPRGEISISVMTTEEVVTGIEKLMDGKRGKSD